MEFSLKNKELIDLDKKIFELGKFYGLAIKSLNRFPNIYAVEEFSKSAKEIIKRLKEIKTEDEFEMIFIENSINNLEAQKAYLNYFSKGDIDIDKMTKIVLGKDAIEILKENIKNFDYKKSWDFYLSYKEYAYKTIPTDDESLRDKFKGILVNLKKDFLAYAKKNYGLPKDYDFDLVLGQPYSNKTSFHPTNRRMEVSPQYFFVFKDKEKIKINSTQIIRALFHEIVGHGRQEALSRKMPLSMQDNSINTSLSTLHIHSEGVAQLVEMDSIQFMKEYKKKYEIEEDYINQVIFSKSQREEPNFLAFYEYLGLRNIENSSFDMDKEFNKVTGNRGLSVLYSSVIKSYLGFVFDANYPLGIYHLKKILDDIKEEMGEEEFNKNLLEINKSISKGVFNIKTLPSFVSLYLKEKGVLKNLKK